MMPLSVADLRQLPAPLGWFERIEVDAVTGPLAQQQDQATVVNKHSKVMTIHA